MTTQTDTENQAMRAAVAQSSHEVIEVVDGEIVDKPYEAHNLRLRGMSWKQIAQRIGYNNEQAAQRAVKIYLQRAAEDLSKERRADALQTALDRVASLMNSHWDLAHLGDVQSGNLVLKCALEIAKLQGLYEAGEENTQKRFILIQGTPEEYAEGLKQLALKSMESKQLTAAESVLPPEE